VSVCCSASNLSQSATMEDGSLPKNPNMEIAQLRFQYVAGGGTDDALRAKIVEAIKADGAKSCTFLFSLLHEFLYCSASILKHLLEMAPYYEAICNELGWMVDEQLLASLKETNSTKLATLDEAIKGSFPVFRLCDKGLLAFILMSISCVYRPTYLLWHCLDSR
jgi:hypothetical protein